MDDKLQVVHNEAARSFEVFVEGYRAHLDYRYLDDQTLDYCHTFVPDELRGRGLAAVITQAALEFAEEKGLTVVPSCSYTQAYLKRQAGRSS